MSNKEWFYQSSDSNVCGFQEVTFDNPNVNPVVIQLENPTEIQLMKNEFQHQMCVSIDIENFDKLAIAWCKKRKLHGALGGPVGREFGSPDSLS